MSCDARSAPVGAEWEENLFLVRNGERGGVGQREPQLGRFLHEEGGGRRRLGRGGLASFRDMVGVVGREFRENLFDAGGPFHDEPVNRFIGSQAEMSDKLAAGGVAAGNEEVARLAPDRAAFNADDRAGTLAV